MIARTFIFTLISSGILAAGYLLGRGRRNSHILAQHQQQQASPFSSGNKPKRRGKPSLRPPRAGFFSRSLIVYVAPLLPAVCLLVVAVALLSAKEDWNAFARDMVGARGG